MSPASAWSALLTTNTRQKQEICIFLALNFGKWCINILDKELCNLRFSDRWRVWTAVTICLSVMALGMTTTRIGRSLLIPITGLNQIIRRRIYDRKWSHSDKLWQVQTCCKWQMFSISDYVLVLEWCWGCWCLHQVSSQYLWIVFFLCAKRGTGFILHTVLVCYIFSTPKMNESSSS